MDRQNKPDPAIQARFQHLINSGSPALIVSVKNRETVAVATRAAQNGPVSTWLSPDNITLGFQAGLLKSTRGFGRDLMSVDNEETLALIAQGQTGRAVRIHRYLDGDDQIIARSFICEIRSRGARNITIGAQKFATRLIEERCQGTDQTFQNLYWISAKNGRVVQSRQWAGPGIGALALRIIVAQGPGGKQ